MAVWRALQDRFGFTRNEVKAIVLLTGTLVLGTVVKMMRTPDSRPIPTFDYRRQDSMFLARSRTAVEGLANETESKASYPRPRRDTPPPPKSVNLNTARRDDLIQLPGIGPAYAERILELRQRLGGFRSIEQLTKVKGIGQRRLEKIRPFVRITEE